jgi:hypothetical protein
MVHWVAIEDITEYSTNNPCSGHRHDDTRDSPILLRGKNSLVETQEGHLEAVDCA